MPLDTLKTRKHLATCSFKPLFIEELGWNHHDARLEVQVDNQFFGLSAIAEKHGMIAFVCSARGDAQIPDYQMRRKIERQVAKTAHEHIIVFVDANKSAQIWQWVRRERGKPTACREHSYQIDQPGDSLVQKLNALAISLEEEESLTLLDVTGRARKAFDIERVTKRFYDRFKAEHATFLEFLEGVPDEEMQRWYVSVMLNRLMFIYFIQKKGFLDGDADYLKNRLSECRKELGKDHYYRDFLCPLFFEGFAKGKADRSARVRKLLGNVPYLNGGIFLPHQIEQLHGRTIRITDKAFEKLFDFFDAYQWHLDERPLRRDDEINPDVLGYIFEKYINQREMGAYYTKEDITEYISRNTVIPFIFDAARAECKVAFENPKGPTIWDLLRNDPCSYIFSAVSYGADKPLPSVIADGIDAAKSNHLAPQRTWNKPAEQAYALPTETWREVIARRTRYRETVGKLAAGEICDINDLITLNLNIRQFAQDVIGSCEGPDLLRAFWHAINKVTILDPTCGSGAFLFAALNILEPLYEGCLDRMEAFIEDLNHSGEKHNPEKYSDFRKVLEQVQTHPNRRYFIFKSIILNNLFGVDIMEEAVEICKLRLFLKLVAQVEPDTKHDNYGIEPLPDIDFNILVGNTLVGFATYADVEQAVTSKLDFDDVMEKISGRAADLQQAFDTFRRLQVEGDGSAPTEQKRELRSHLMMLQNDLNVYLAREYGVDPTKKGAFTQWLKTHKPFHWFIEFYGIVTNGGFDVIIGNPPYVNATKVQKKYSVKNLSTLACPDIYAWILERGESLLRDGGRSGMIVPLSLGFSGDFATIRNRLYTAYSRNWFSSFGRIPSALFSFDVRVRNTIHIGYKTDEEGQQYTSRLHRWFESARLHLFPTLEYAMFQHQLWHGRVPKLNSQALASAYEQCLSSARSTVEAATTAHATPHVLHFKKTAYNWLNFCRNLPPCFEGKHRVEHTQFGQMYFLDAETCELALLLGNGKLPFVMWCAVGDDFHVTLWNFGEFPMDFTSLPVATRSKLLRLVPKLEKAMEEATQFKLNAGRRVGNYNLAKCRHITDKSDRIFAEALGLLHVWEDIELYCTQVVKTDFSLDEDDTRDIDSAYGVRSRRGQAAKAAEDPE